MPQNSRSAVFLRMEEALEDAYYWLIFQQAVQTPGRQVQSGVMPWHAAKH